MVLMYLPVFQQWKPQNNNDELIKRLIDRNPFLSDGVVLAGAGLCTCAVSRSTEGK